MLQKGLSQGVSRDPYIPGWDTTGEVLKNDLERAKSISDKQGAANKLKTSQQ